MDAWLSRRLNSALCSGIVNRKFGGSAMLVLVGMKGPDSLAEGMVSNAFFLSFFSFFFIVCFGPVHVWSRGPAERKGRGCYELSNCGNIVSSCCGR